MRKMQFQTNDKAVQKYINELQKQFPQYEVNINNANDFSIMLQQKENCKTCLGLSNCKNDIIGHALNYQNGVFVACQCRYKKNEIAANSRNSLIKTLYLPSKILEATLESFHTEAESRKKIYTETVEFIQKYKNGEDVKGLYLYGKFSIGKTYALACIANELAKNNVSCLLIYFPDLIVDLKNAMGSPRYEKLLNMLKSIDVLMLDDLGSENITPWLRDEVLGPVLNYRVLEKKPLFVTSNYGEKEIMNHFCIDNSPSSQVKGKRVASRLKALVQAICMDDGQKYQR